MRRLRRATQDRYVDVTGGTGAFATAIGVDAWRVVFDSAAYHGPPDRYFHLMLGPIVLDINDLRHSTSLDFRCSEGRRLYRNDDIGFAAVTPTGI